MRRQELRETWDQVLGCPEGQPLRAILPMKCRAMWAWTVPRSAGRHPGVRATSYLREFSSLKSHTGLGEASVCEHRAD